MEGAVWRVVVPSEVGPQALGVGGEVAIWRSEDSGKNWELERKVTQGSELNHSYVRRPVNAHPDFYAFWCDGNPDTFSESRLYFMNKAGTVVKRLPYRMDGERVKPERVE